MKIQNQSWIKSKQAKRVKEIKGNLRLRIQFSVCPWKHGLEGLQEIWLSEGRITYTYSIYLTWTLLNTSGYLCLKHYLLPTVFFFSFPRPFSFHKTILHLHSSVTFVQTKCTQMQSKRQPKIIPRWWYPVSSKTNKV